MFEITDLNRYQLVVTQNGQLRPAHTVSLGQRGEPGFEERRGIDPGQEATH
ncbi:MAG TPA: hypothetical protein VFU43_27840 [Streptosporangiaceae bacterium]|nr:hypothetical protein [Streptosporangiaceae bacterium]